MTARQSFSKTGCTTLTPDTLALAAPNCASAGGNESVGTGAEAPLSEGTSDAGCDAPSEGAGADIKSAIAAAGLG